MPEHDHSHGLGFAEPEHATIQSGNIEIHETETALAAYSETHANLPVWTMAELIDDLDNLSTWTGQQVTFSFPDTESPDYIGNSREGTLAPLTQAQQDAARTVFALYADLIDLDFVDLGLNNDPGDDVNADIRFYNSSLEGTAGGASAGAGTAGDAWFYNYDQATVHGYDLDPGSYQYHLFVHELGHVMGLSHTSFVSGDTYEARATYLQNNAAYSAMSYLTAGSGGLLWDTTYSATPMLADVAALQSLYGANMATRAGDTVYGFNATADRQAFDFDAVLDIYGDIAAVTIWDAGGTDTLDMSKFGADGFINLAAGSHSSVGGYDLNVAIAAGAVIENANAGNGDDVVLGNAENNTIEGGRGADTLVGGDGNDRLIGDTLLDQGGNFDHGVVTLLQGQSVDYVVDAAGITALTIEMLISFDAQVTGTQWFADLPGDWTIVQDTGNGGLWLRSNDSWTNTGISAAALADGDLHRLSIVYDGDSAEVRIYLDGVKAFELSGANVPPLKLANAENVGFSHEGGLADVRIFDSVRSEAEIADNAFSTLDAVTPGLISHVVFEDDSAREAVGNGAVKVSSGAEFSEIAMVGFDDVLEGGDGNDILTGGRGADVLAGGAGADTADYRRSDMGVEVDLTQGTGTGGDAQGDTYTLIERVFGSGQDDVIVAQEDDNTLRGYDGHDQISGLAGQDALSGGSGKDFLDGGDGSDIIQGDSGNDRLRGGAGTDYFVFSQGDGTDRIKDFDLVTDVLVFADAAEISDLTFGYHLLGGFVTDGDAKVILEGISVHDLDEVQIMFGEIDLI